MQQEREGKREKERKDYILGYEHYYLGRKLVIPLEAFILLFRRLDTSDLHSYNPDGTTTGVYDRL